MLLRKPGVFADPSPEISVRAAAAWSGAVGGLLLILILLALFG